MTPRPPRTNAERDLERLQRTVIQGLRAAEERNELLRTLWEGGMTQRELALRLTRASRAAGGGEVSPNAVFKLMKRRRREVDEAENGVA